MRLRNIPRAEQVITESAHCINNPAEYKGKWRKEVFKNDNPIHIEIGMGKGQFILSLAKANPDINYIGIERYASVLLRAVEKLEGVRQDLIGDASGNVSDADSGTDSNSVSSTDSGIASGTVSVTVSDTVSDTDSGIASGTDSNSVSGSDFGKDFKEIPSFAPTVFLPADNLKLLCFDAAELATIFEPSEVDCIYLNFSDPWPKARHARRRLTSPEYLNRYKQVLNPKGQLEFKTDNRGLFDFSVESVNASADWEIEACTYDLHHDEKMNVGNVMTEYEEKFSSMNHPIHKLIARLQ